jgi:hypothetical protein
VLRSLRLERAKGCRCFYSPSCREGVFSETQTVCTQTYLGATLPITIRKGGESTKEKVSVGRKRDDEGLQDWEKDRDQDRQEDHDERQQVRQEEHDERQQVRQEEHDEREEVRREEREDRKQAREDERERRRRSP